MSAQRSNPPSLPSSAHQRFTRTDSQTSAASKKSEQESKHSSSVGRQTPTQQISSKPPTAGSRPGILLNAL
jgi:hypothetical protein